MATRDRVRNLGAGWVFEADQPGEDHVLFVAGRSRLVDGAMRERQDTQAGAGHLVLCGQQACAGGGIERCQAGVEVDEAAAREHAFERPFAVEHASVRRFGEHRHALAVGVEGDLVDAGKGGEVAGDLAADLGQGNLHRIAVQRLPSGFFDRLQVVAQRGIDEQLAMLLQYVRARRQVAAWHEGAAYPQSLHRHPVLRQRAGLVAADHGRRTERLDRRQVAHQRVAPSHSLRRHGQRQGHRRQQSFRDVGDDDADGEQQVLPGWQPHCLTDEEQQDAHAGRQAGDDARKTRDLALQR
jgi:hypothetical protein